MSTLAEERSDWRVPRASEERCADAHGKAVGLASSPTVSEAAGRHSQRSGRIGEFPKRLGNGALTLREAVDMASSPSV